jgi:hypothetical protein
VSGGDIFTQIAVSEVHYHIRCGLVKQLTEFARLNIKNALLDHDYSRATAALTELRRIYVGLATVLPEYERQVEAMDAGLDRLHHAMRTSLLRDYVRSQDPAEVMSISETLSECIAADREWDWEPEFEKALTEQMAS